MYCAVVKSSAMNCVGKKKKSKLESSTIDIKFGGFHNFLTIFEIIIRVTFFSGPLQPDLPEQPRASES